MKFENVEVELRFLRNSVKNIGKQFENNYRLRNFGTAKNFSR